MGGREEGEIKRGRREGRVHDRLLQIIYNIING